MPAPLRRKPQSSHANLLSWPRCTRSASKSASAYSSRAGSRLAKSPAEGLGMAEFMASIEGGQGATAQEFAFTAADKSAVKKTAPAWFAEFIGARKPLVRLGHRADPAGDAQSQLDARDPRAIAQAANEFIAAEAAKGRTVQIDAAVMHITRAAAG